MREDRKLGDKLINCVVCEVAGSAGFTVNPLEERPRLFVTQFKQCVEADSNPWFLRFEPNEWQFSA